MSALPAVLWLQESAPATDYSFFMMMGMIFLIFYFLLIRPQQRRQKEQEQMLKSVEKGDSVVTSGGVHGKVTGVTDDILTIEIATLKSGDRVRVKVERSRLDKVTKAGDKDAKSANKDAKSANKDAKSAKKGSGS